MNNFDHSYGAWFSLDGCRLTERSPLSLVTIQLDRAAEEAALQFIEAAERRIIEEWASRGQLLLALVSHDRRELNLLIASDETLAQYKAEDIPSVASELAHVTVRGVTALPLVSQRKFAPH
jgi:hypothetical protein